MIHNRFNQKGVRLEGLEGLEGRKEGRRAQVLVKRLEGTEKRRQLVAN